MAHDGLSDGDVRALLERVESFAVVGASPKPDRPSYGVMQYLIGRGYRVLPVNPGFAGKSIQEQKVYGRLADVPGPVDVIDVFRASDAVAGVVQEAIAEKARLQASVVWMQLGVINEDAADEARRAGFTVVVDRCPKIEYARLLRG